MKSKPPKTPAAEVVAFRERHGLIQEDVDRLFGFSSGGRACRRWEEDVAPHYVSVLIAYADKFGLDLMRELADKQAK